MRLAEINVVHSSVSLQNTISSTSKKRRVLEDDEHDHSFDNISMAIDRLDSVSEVMTKFFSKISGADVHATLEALDLELILETAAYIFFYG